MKNVEDTFKINLYRHSMAHIMAYAIQNIFKDIKLGFGPPTENGFYYDFDLGEKKIELKDFPKIEEEMKKIIKNNFEYLRNELKHEDTLKDNWINKEPYKKIQVDKLHGEGVNSFSFYKTGEFLDLCEGPHIQNTSELSDIAFKLDRISGAYWLGSEKNKMLTRIYALCFMTQAELDEFLERRKKAEEWDHKKLGKELDIFMIDENIGKGLILWKPNGTVLREEIEKYAKEMEFKYGYQRVATPHIAKEKLFLQSGHLPAYQESMFPPIVVTEDNEVKDKFYLKPMNCPFHHTIFGSKLRSYREMPLRLAEYGTCYRFEQSGELSGLLRVRCLTMNDAHIYCPESGLQDELKSILSMYKEFYTKFKLNNYYFRLSIRGKENSAKFIGDSNLWEKAEKILADVLNTLKIPYEIGEGEAAFYGPKIDIQFKNLLGREETVSTIQVDFQAAIKFDLSYIAENGEASKPVVIHRAPLSTHERFISFILEYYGGAFPVWLAPVQVMLVPVNAVFNEHCLAIEKELRNLFIRSETDVSDNSFNKKIRTNVTRKIPIILIVGNNEVQNNEVTVRRYGKTEQTKMKKDDFIKTILDEIKNREF